MIMRSDDLPDPEGPVSPSVSPRGTLRLIPFRISTGPAFPSRDRCTSSRVRTGSVMVALKLIRSFGYGARTRARNLLAAGLLALTAGAAAAEVVIAALGDSLTQGYGLAQETGFVPQMERWLRANGAEVRLINAGVSGDTTAGGLARINWTLTDDVDALIVALGGNDVLRGIDPGVARDNLDGILAVAQERGLPVLLVGIAVPPNYGSEYQDAFLSIYPELAEKYDTALYPDFLAPITAGERQSALGALMQGDGIHPNARGVEAVVEAMGPSVLKLVERAE